ncbi:hypothetical protein [Sorangium sp. So ce204]|uniref:hypothetical protein n=1 Tax=Sorangium sp. So ce204 TaxID=3133288 RepID=UPI003F5D912A
MNDERTRLRSSRTSLALMGLSTAALIVSLVSQLRPAPAEGRPPREAPSREAGVIQEPAPEPAAGHGDSERVIRLERRIADLESAAAPQEDDGPEAAPNKGREDAEPRDLEAMRREETAWWTGVLDAHAQQRRDAGWAERAEESFQADLDAIAPGRGLEIVDVDCRTTSCAATIRWPSYTPEVMDDAGFLAGRPYRERCAKSISVPPPEDPSAPYESKIVFDCATQRAGLAHR